MYWSGTSPVFQLKKMLKRVQNFHHFHAVSKLFFKSFLLGWKQNQKELFIED